MNPVLRDKMISLDNQHYQACLEVSNAILADSGLLDLENYNPLEDSRIPEYVVRRTAHMVNHSGLNPEELALIEELLNADEKKRFPSKNLLTFIGAMKKMVTYNTSFDNPYPINAPPKIPRDLK